MLRKLGFSALLGLLAGSAMATPSDIPSQLDQEQPTQQQAVEEAADAAMAEMFQPGAVQPGWDKGGVDIYKLVESAPGGFDRNYLLSFDKDGDRTVRIIRAKDLGTYVPKDWKPIMRARSAELSNSEILEFSGFDGPFKVVGWETHRRVGDSFCSYGNMNVELYEAPGHSKGEIPTELVPTFFQAPSVWTGGRCAGDSIAKTTAIRSPISWKTAGPCLH